MGCSGSNGVSDMIIDHNGDILLAGNFKGSGVFNNSSSYIFSNTSSFEDAFVTKYSAAGSSIWFRAWGGSDQDRAQGIAVDSANHVYITGYFKGTVDFDTRTTTNNLTSNGGRDLSLIHI